MIKLWTMCLHRQFGNGKILSIWNVNFIKITYNPDLVKTVPTFLVSHEQFWYLRNFTYCYKIAKTFAQMAKSLSSFVKNGFEPLKIYVTQFPVDDISLSWLQLHDFFGRFLNWLETLQKISR